MNNMGSINYAKEKHIESPYQRYKHLGVLIISDRSYIQYKYPFDIDNKIGAGSEQTHELHYKIPLSITSITDKSVTLTIILQLPHYPSSEVYIEKAFQAEFEQEIYKKLRPYFEG